MATFEFTKKTNSSVLQVDEGNQTPVNGLYTPVALMPVNKILQLNPVTRLIGLMTKHNINIDIDTVIIDGATFNGSTAKELYNSLETIFFLDDGEASSDVSGASRVNEVSSSTDVLLMEMIDEQKLTNKLLRKIYNPE